MIKNNIYYYMQAFYKWFTDNGGFYDGVSVA